MMSKKNRIVIAVTVGVTLAGLGSAAALTYDLNRPFYEARAHARLAVPIAPEDISGGVAVSAAETVSAQAVQSVLYVPEITIVASAPRHP